MRNHIKMVSKSIKIDEKEEKFRSDNKPWSWAPRGGRFAPEPPLKNGTPQSQLEQFRKSLGQVTDQARGQGQGLRRSAARQLTLAPSLVLTLAQTLSKLF